MEQDLAKSLVELIDQTIAEIEELKKSDRFAATEIKLEGPGEGIAGKDPQGKLEAKKAEEEEEEGDEAEEKEDKEDEIEKGVLDEAEKKKALKKEEEEEEDEDEEEPEVEKAEPKEGYEIKKSEEEMNTLMKSMIDERVKPLESKIDSILGLIKELADAPVAPKSVSYRDVAPLKKSMDDEAQPLSKADVATKLFELKKSGTYVDSVDIAQAELGNPATLQKIVTKYNIK